MNREINWKLVLTIGILLGTLIIIFLIGKLSKKNKLTDTTPTIVNPVNIAFKQNCVNIRTPCNPKDPKSCQTSCTEEELKCVNLDDITPTPDGKAMNGGGSVCLPDYPKIHCNTSNGGVYVWTGYGFTDNQTWDCYCMYPEFFGGPGCEKPNPDICSGGKIDLTKLGTGEPTANMCVCPPDTMLLLRGGINTPYCESIDPTKGGGMYGLAGSLHVSPDWRNILYRQPITSGSAISLQSTQDWATDIVTELTASPCDPTKKSIKNMIDQVKATLDSVNCSTCTNRADPCNNYCIQNYLTNINESLADQICKDICPNSCNDICDCSTNTAKWSNQTSTATTKMTYTYDSNDIPPSNYCTPPCIQYYCSNNCAGNSTCPAGVTCYSSHDECKKACPK